jgi:hypothetical protein
MKEVNNILERKEIIVDESYGPEVEKIFGELIKTKEIEKMTDSETLNFQENLKKLIDIKCDEKFDISLKMAMVARAVWFPKEVLVGMYSFTYPAGD